MVTKKAVVFLMGQTASGKSEAAMLLAQQLPGEIVNVDSAQIYRYMDIGTAKPGIAERESVAHHLLDLRDPHESYSAAQFCLDAHEVIEAIFARGNVPILVGGTGLYFRALEQGLAPLPPANPDVRARILGQAQTLGWQALHRQLCEIDPESAQRIHHNDAQRIQRALEVYYASGETLSQFWKRETSSKFLYPVIKCAIRWQDKMQLWQRIERRFNAMVSEGLIDEVVDLRARFPVTAEHASMRAVGYRQVWRFLDGEIERNEVAQQGVFATRQYAKRQLTWLRKEEDLFWFSGGTKGLEKAILSHILSKLANL